MAHQPVSSVIKDIYIRDNTLTNLGYGWAGPDRCFPRGKGIAIKQMEDVDHDDGYTIPQVSVAIENNTIDTFKWSGIYAWSGNVSIRYNTIKNGTAQCPEERPDKCRTPGAGITITGSDWTTDYSYGECTGEIRDNYIYNNVGHEIFVKHNMPYPEKGGLNIYNNILCVDTGEYGGKTNTLEHNLYYREDGGGNVWKWYFKSYISKTFNGTQIEAYREYSNQDSLSQYDQPLFLHSTSW